VKKSYKPSNLRTPVSNAADSNRATVVLRGPIAASGGSSARCHGTLVSVLDVGILLRGVSGIGKSECALELIRRGFCLVADDVVLLESKAGNLMGSSPESIRHHLEIRGVGIVDICELYGTEAVLERHKVDLVCDLENWEPGKVYDRVGAEREQVALVEVKIPRLVLPLRAMDSLATVVELAARDHLQRGRGQSAAARLDARIGGVRSS
jgi:HPr kinase/phosphorylase